MKRQNKQHALTPAATAAAQPSPSAPAATEPLDRHGRPVRVGCTIMDNDGVVGQVCHIAGNVIVYRVFQGQPDISPEETHAAEFRPSVVTVLMDPTPAAAAAVTGAAVTLPGRGAWCASVALDLARVARRIGDFNAKDTIGNNAKKWEEAEGQLLQLSREFWQQAGEEVELFNKPEAEAAAGAEGQMGKRGGR